MYFCALIQYNHTLIDIFMKTFFFILLSVTMLQAQVDSLCDLAYEREDAGDFREAVRLNQQALSLTPEDSLEWISIISNNLSTEYFYLCDLETAAEYALQAMRIDERRGDSIGLSCSLNQLVVVCMQMQQYGEAYRMTKRAIRIEEQLVAAGIADHRSVLAARLGILSEICTKQDLYDEAYEASERAIAIDREIGDARKLGVHLSQQAAIYTKQAQYDRALPILEESLRLLRKTGNVRSLIITLVPYAQALSTQHRSEEAIAALKECVVLSYQTGQRDTRLHAVHELALLQQNTSAKPYFDHYTRLRDSIYSDQMQERVAEMEVRYDTEKKQLEIERQQAIVSRQRLTMVVIILLAVLLLVLILFALWYARRQREIAREKNRMVSILSHDLKSPALAQQRVLRLMADGGLASSPDVQQQLADAQDKQVNLILNMLDYARLEAGRVVPEPIRTDVALVAEDVVGLLAQQASQRGVRLRIQEEQSLIVLFDRTMLHTILRNLVSNAIKFSPADSEVVIHIAEGCVSVEDHGEGFGSTSGEKGTGLGLDICRRFARLNHATLTIQSEPGQGTCIDLRFAAKTKQ